MADDTTPTAQPAEDTKKSEATAAPDTKADPEKPTSPAAEAEAKAASPEAKKNGDKADGDAQDKPAEADEKKDKDEADADESTAAKGEDSAPPTAQDKSADDDVDMATDPVEDKGGKGRRKSGAGAGPKDGKKLNKKASKAKLQNLDAKPGDYFYTKLKGYPWWPTIVCDEDMLSRELLNKRPVSAARPDGSYREDFADGGKRAGDRSFAVMFLHTNEFSWVPNTDLKPLDTSVVESEITDKMRKDLQAAHHLAAENNDLDYFKNVLREFEEARTAKLERAEAKAAAKATKTPRKSKAASFSDQDGDLEMADIDDDLERSGKKSKSKKRKADDEAATPARSDSVKKPKIKLTTSSTPKAANGTKSPTVKDSATKAAKSKPKAKNGTTDGKKSEKNTPVPKEPELSPEERQQRKEKEILFLRHRLQRGLISKEGPPKEEEMPSMSDFLGKLEQFPDLEASIIRATKINKVLKAIIKLNNIPKEAELKFKPRSQTLLDKWNAVLAADEGAPASAASAAAPANGVNGQSTEAAKTKEASNGAKEASAEAKAEPEKAKKETEDKPQKESSEEKAAGEKEPESKKTPEKDDKVESKEEATVEKKETAAAVESTA